MIRVACVPKQSLDSSGVVVQDERRVNKTLSGFAENRDYIDRVSSL